MFKRIFKASHIFEVLSIGDFWRASISLESLPTVTSGQDSFNETVQLSD